MGNAVLTRSTVAGLVGAATIIMLVSGCAGLPSGMQRPAVTLADLGVANAGLFEQQFNLRLRIQNPNPDELKIDGIAFELAIDGQPFAKGVGNQAIAVPRYGSAFMTVEAVTTLGGLLKQFGRLIEGNKSAFNYRIKGVLSMAGGPQVPFEETGEFDLASLIRRPLLER